MLIRVAPAIAFSLAANAASGQITWMGGAEPPSCDNCWRVADNWAGGFVPGIDPAPPGGPDDLRGVDVEITSGVSPVRGNQSGTQLGNLTSTLPLELTVSSMTISGDALFTDTQFGSAILPLLNLFVGGGATLDGSSTLQNARFRGGPYIVNGPALVQDVPLNSEEVILDATVMMMEGAVTAESDIQFDNGAQLIINDTWTASGNSADLGAFAIDADEGTVEVNGEFVAAGGDVDLNIPASGAGTINAQAGTLSVNEGGSFTGGSWEIAQDAMLVVRAVEGAAEPLIAGGVNVSGAGSLRILGQPWVIAEGASLTASLDGAPASAFLWLSGTDRLRIDGALVNSGRAVWTRAIIEGPAGDEGGFINDGLVLISDDLEDADPVLNGRLSNRGTITQLTDLTVEGDGELVNEPGGTYQLVFDRIRPGFDSAGRFVNKGGTLLVPDDGQSAAPIVEIPLDQRDGGIISVQRDFIGAGDSLILSGGGQWGAGGGVIEIGDTIDMSINDGTYVVTGSGHEFVASSAILRISADARLEIAGGIALTNRMSGSATGGLRLTGGGVLAGPGTLDNRGSMILRGGEAHDAVLILNGQDGQLNVETLTLQGTLRNLNEREFDGFSFAGLSPGVTTMVGGALIDNLGTASFVSSHRIEGDGQFDNSGTLISNPFIAIGDVRIEAELDNTGVVLVRDELLFVQEVVQLENGVLDGGTWIVSNEGTDNGRLQFGEDFDVLDIGPNTTFIGRSVNGETPLERLSKVLGGIVGINGDTDFNSDLSNEDGGTIQIDAGADVTAPTITNGRPEDDPDGGSILDEIETGDIVIARGDLTHPPTITTSVLTNHARLLPGGDGETGPFFITGDLVQGPTGRLLIDIASLDDFDLFTITGGDAALAGTLDLSLLADYTPDPGDTFTILTADAVSGAFDAVVQPTGTRFSVEISSTEVRIVSRCLADLAEPYGFLDLADVTAFVAGFTTMDPVADLDSNGLFDLTDVSLFVGAFVAGCP